jgi:methionine-rich copper-binding protein CopC
MIRLLFPLAVAAICTASPALAHALLERAVPPVGGEVVGPPHQIVLTFTEGVEPLFSTIQLHDAHGSVVPAGKPQRPPGSDRQLVLDLPPLPSGEYTVIWHVTSVDTHKTEGSYRFTIR